MKKQELLKLLLAILQHLDMAASVVAAKIVVEAKTVVEAVGIATLLVIW